MERKKNLKRKLEISDEALAEHEKMINPTKKRKQSSITEEKKEENQTKESSTTPLTLGRRKRSTNVRKKRKSGKSADEVTFRNSSNSISKQKSKSVIKPISKTKPKSKTQSKIVSKKKKQRADPEPPLRTIENINKNYSGCCKLNVLILDVQIIKNRISVIIKDYGIQKMKFIAFNENVEKLKVLKPGKFYQIKCPKIKDNPAQYSIYSKFILRLGPLTKIQSLAKSSIGRLNLHADKGWEFKNLHHAMKLSIKKRVDVLIVIGFVSNIIHLSNGSARKDLQVYDDSGMMSYVTLWPPHCYKHFEKGEIIALSQAQVIYVGGVLSKPGFIEAQPDVPQKIKLQSWLQKKTESMKQLEFNKCKQAYLNTITKTFHDIYKIQHVFKQNPRKQFDNHIIFIKEVIITEIDSGELLKLGQDYKWSYVLKMNVRNADYTTLSLTAYDDIGNSLFGQSASITRDLQLRDMPAFANLITKSIHRKQSFGFVIYCNTRTSQRGNFYLQWQVKEIIDSKKLTNLKNEDLKKGDDEDDSKNHFKEQDYKQPQDDDWDEDENGYNEDDEDDENDDNEYEDNNHENHDYDDVNNSDDNKDNGANNDQNDDGVIKNDADENDNFDDDDENVDDNATAADDDNGDDKLDVAVNDGVNTIIVDDITNDVTATVINAVGNESLNVNKVGDEITDQNYNDEIVNSYNNQKRNVVEKSNKIKDFVVTKDERKHENKNKNQINEATIIDEKKENADKDRRIYHALTKMKSLSLDNNECHMVEKDVMEIVDDDEEEVIKEIPINN